MTTEGVVNSKLPFWETIGISYSFYFQHLADVLRISWLWLLIFVPLVGVTSWLQSTWFAKLVANMRPGKPPLAPAVPTEMTLLGNVSTLVMFLAGCSIAVAWHRLVLLGEQPGLSGGNIISRNLWRYLGVGLVILMIAGFPLLAAIVPIWLWGLPHATGGGMPATSAAASNPAIFFLVPIAYLALTIIVVRLCLLLPARAIGDTRVTFKEMWSLTRGNAWRIFWGVVACSAPPMLVAQIVLLTFVGFPNPTRLANDGMAGSWIVFNAIASGYYLLTLPIFVGFLSNAFLFISRTYRGN
jgi:hypothetical protein